MNQDKIRNFAIIAHIDHGKTTLTDRLLEHAGQYHSKNKERALDSHPIEQERGITIKLAPVSLHQEINQKDYLFNLIDTPGHIDFNYEVERSLAACEGALLLVDATKGVEAQTITNLRLARKQNLSILPVINKIDLPAAEPDETELALIDLIPEAKEILRVSAKSGLNADQILPAIARSIPAPQGNLNSPLRALIFNSTYHPHLGVIAFIRVIDGEIKTNQKLHLLAKKTSFIPTSIGIFTPEMTASTTLSAGSVGYLATGLKDIKAIAVGDTLTHEESASIISPLPGYRHIKPNVYLEVYPQDNSDYNALLDAIDKIKLHDAALTTEPVSSPALGNGVRVGFLGLLHSDIFSERLDRDFDLSVTMTSPSVEYEITTTSNQQITINRASDFPDPSTIKLSKEPVAKITIITPQEYLGNIITLLEDLRGSINDTNYLNEKTVELTYTVPLIEVITHLHDRLKSVSSGFASLDYELEGFKEVKLLKLEVLLNNDPIEPLSRLEVKEKALPKARELATKLKELIPQHQIKIAIQVKAGGDIIAREDIKAFRKDVTAKLYGGDRTRRMKLLEKQKKGKKKMRQFGSISLPPEVFKKTI